MSREREHRRRDGPSGDLARHGLAGQRASVHGYGGILASDEEARHVMLPRGRFVRWQGEAEGLAEATPGQPHIEVAGPHRLAVVVAGSLDASTASSRR